jgi:hypothetical protein
MNRKLILSSQTKIEREANDLNIIKEISTKSKQKY